ncbi:MAG: zinc ribbon domain-containing protein [Bacteroidaceae bacterium]|nr:zinc ribbon domain-containing protein [Bacteroidaceae bacterium]
MKPVPFLLVFLTCLLTACTLPPRASEAQRPYGVGYNFHVHAESLLLQEDRPMHWCQGVAETSDSLFVFHDNHIVVAAITVIPEDCVDSVWVKVARDQFTMGWTHETDLLAAASPDDPISQAIRLLSTPLVQWLLSLLTVFLMMALCVSLRLRHPAALPVLRDIPTMNPTLLMICLLASLCFYAVIQQQSPELWAQFYFHPTLNPFSQPWQLCLFLASLWLTLLLAILCVDDAFSLLSARHAVIYLLALCDLLLLLLLLARRLSPTLLFLCSVSLGCVLLYRYWHHARPLYTCGSCGAPLRHKGTCPHCGVIND